MVSRALCEWLSPRGKGRKWAGIDQGYVYRKSLLMGRCSVKYGMKWSGSVYINGFGVGRGWIDDARFGFAIVASLMLTGGGKYSDWYTWKPRHVDVYRRCEKRKQEDEIKSELKSQT